MSRRSETATARTARNRYRSAAARPGAHHGWRTVLRALAGLFLLVAALWAIDRVLPGVTQLTDWGRLWLSTDWWFSMPEFVIAGTLLCACGLPRQSVALVGGYLFGTGIGTVLALASMLAGCLLTYHIARQAGANRLRRQWPGLAGRLDRWAHDRVFARTLMIRLFPVGSNLLTNIGAGVSGARQLPFLLGSAIGFLPQTLVFALGGSSVDQGSVQPLLLAGALLLTSVLLGVWLWHVGEAAAKSAVLSDTDANTDSGCRA